ncbi:MAG: hypothetical protein ACRDVC_01825 [Acidimicrobiales bacterium]
MKPGAVVQAQKLVSIAANMGALPTCLFCNGTSLGHVGDDLPLEGCTAGILVRGKSGPPWTMQETPGGCSLADANVILDILKTRLNLDRRVLENSVPWECILCPFLSHAGGRPSAIPWNTLPNQQAGRIDGPINAPWLSSDTPGWVRDVFEGDNNQDLRDVRYFLSIDGTQG